MGLFRQLLGGGEERRSTLKYPDEALLKALRGDAGVLTASGVSVTHRSAMGYSAVVSAVRILSESVAQLPLILYERDGGRRWRAVGHPLYGLLHDAPNGVQDAFTFWELAVQHLLAWGNFYAELVFDESGQVRAMWPLNPREMRVEMENGAVVYRLGSGGARVPYVLHIRGMAKDGLVGQSVLSAARTAIGLGMAAEEFGARFFGNGALPGVVLQHPGVLGPEGRRNLRESWNEAYSGLGNSHRVAVLEEGLTVEKIGIPPEDAQFLETRKFQVTEIARIYRVPPHMMADLDRATFSNIEHLGMEFVVHSLGPWLKRIETALRVQLLDDRERQRFYAEFLVDSLLRGDIDARYKAYATGRQWGWLSANDVRRLENMNPIDGGDEYLTPMNMIEAGSPPEPPSDSPRKRGEAPTPGPSPACGGGESGARRRGDATHLERRAQEGDEVPEAAVRRRRLARAQVGMIQSVAQRVINREVNDVGNAARRLLGGDEDVQGFRDWLTDFYGRENHAAFVREYLAPVFGAYADLVVGEVADETGKDVSGADMADWVDDYLRSRANIWCKEHRVALERSASPPSVPPASGGEGEDAALERVEETLAGMKEREAESFANDQAYRFNNALALAAYAVVGRTLKRWVAFGKSCPYCSQLDGMIVGIEMTFLAPGEALEDGEGGRYVTKGHVKHAPLHGGCDCMVVSA